MWCYLELRPTGSALIIRVEPLWKGLNESIYNRTLVSSLTPSSIRGHSIKEGCLWTRKSALNRHHICWLLDLDFTAFRTVRSKCPWLHKQPRLCYPVIAAQAVCRFTALTLGQSSSFLWRNVPSDLLLSPWLTCSLRLRANKVVSGLPLSTLALDDLPSTLIPST